MPVTHLEPRRPKPFFGPEYVSDNSDPDTDVEDLQLHADIPPSMTNSEVSSEASDPASEPPSEAGEALFSPSLSTQRHGMVLEILSRELVGSILDTGCNSLKFISLAKHMTGVNLVIGVDLDKDILEEYKFLATPTASRWLDERPEDFVLELWHGDVTDGAGAEVMRGRVEAVTSIELIEHLEPDMVESFTRTVLGVVRPRLWVVTTPNRDYNQLFPDWPGPDHRRHWDHRFEWSRAEFRSWVERVERDFPEYSTSEVGGVGFTEGCRESHGPASQSVVFRFNGNWEPSQDPSSEKCDVWQCGGWSKIVSNCLPKRVDTRSRPEKIAQEALFHANAIAWSEAQNALSIEPYEEIDSVFVSFERIMQFDFVEKFETNLEEVEVALKTVDDVNIKVVEDGLEINILTQDESNDEDSDEDEEYFETYCSLIN